MSVGLMLYVYPLVDRTFLTSINPLLNQSRLPLLAFVNKGIEAGTRALTLEIIADTCGNDAARNASFIVSPDDLTFFQPLSSRMLALKIIGLGSPALRSPKKVRGLSAYSEPRLFGVMLADPARFPDAFTPQL